MKKILLLVVISIISSMTFAEICPTKIDCPIDTTCSCSPGASTYSNRYFYAQFTLNKNKHYVCSLESLIGDYPANLFYLDGIDYTDDLILEGAENTRFPLNFRVDTTKMSALVQVMSVKFLVPASDMAYNFKTICKEVFV